MKRNLMKSILCSLLIVALLAAPVSAFAASKVAYIFKVSVSGAPGTYMRSGSSKAGGSSSDVIGSLKNGTKVIYSGKKSGQMLYVTAANGKSGYVYQGNLKNYGAVNVRQIYVTTSSTGVYKKSSGSMRKVGTVSAGIPVVVFSTSGNYAYVRNLSGKTAYIPMSALKSLY